MDSGLLLFLNFLSILFWAEVEMLGKADGRFPTFSKIIRFRMIFGKRWVKIYAIFLILFALLVLFSLFSKKNHPASFGNLISIGIFQIIGLFIVLYSIEKSKK